MNRRPVNEKKAFNCEDQNLPFYTECVHRKIQKKGPPSIYHYHSNIELIYCIEGELAVNIPTEQIILLPGDFIFLAPNTPHETFAKSDYNEHIFIKFLPSIIHVPASRKIPPVNYFISLMDDYCVFKASDDTKDYISNLFFDSLKNTSHTDYFKRLIFRSNVMRLMSFVFTNAIPKEIVESQETIPNAFLSVLDYIDNNLSTITLEDAADYCSLSYSYFSRTFKSIFKTSFSNYVMKKRIENAMRLMAEMKMSLNDIALECGFSNLSHFIKCFSAEKGMTPKQFRTMTTIK